MNTIALPDALYHEAKRYAEAHNITVESVCNQALTRFLMLVNDKEPSEESEIRRQINAVYATQTNRLPIDLQLMQILSLPKEDW